MFWSTAPGTAREAALVPTASSNADVAYGSVVRGECQLGDEVGTGRSCAPDTFAVNNEHLPVTLGHDVGDVSAVGTEHRSADNRRKPRSRLSVHDHGRIVLAPVHGEGDAGAIGAEDWRRQAVDVG